MKSKSPKGKYVHYEDGTRIRLGQDDVPEQTATDFAKMTPLRDSFPELAAHAQKRKAGRPKSAAPKQLQSFKLSPDVIDGIRNSGPGYNVRVEAALRKALDEGRI